jgi:putative ABC transport system permease protein
VVILAVGIGANTGVFSVVNAVLLAPLPYQEPDRLVTLFRQKKGGFETNVPPENFAYWREHQEAFERVAAYASLPVYVTGIDDPRHVRAVQVSACFFPLLGATPILGRTFLPEEEEAGNHRAVVLSHGFWRDQWGTDPNVIGETLELDGEQHMIIGIMPSDFRFPMLNSAPFWVPLVLEESYAVMPIARLKPDVTIEQARAHMALMGRQLEEVDPQRNAGRTITVHRYLDDLFGNNRRILLLLLGAAGFVLLIACSNVANLLLARAILRRQEIGIRLALGASRGRIMRQLLTESIILSTAAGLLGLLATYWVVKGLVGLCPADIPRIRQVRVDITVLAFTLGLSMLTGLLFGLIPAWRTADVHLGQTLKEGQVRSPAGRGWQRLRDGLVVSQLGITLTLLMGAALLIRSLVALHKVDLGFQVKNVLAMHVELPRVKYPEYHQRRAFFDQLVQEIRTVPGVQSAALVSVRLALASRGGGTDLISIGSRPTDTEQLSQVHSNQVGRDFFETMGIPVLRGRAFTEQDMQTEPIDAQRGLIIDQRFAQRYFPNVDPIGQRIYFGQRRSGVVVGVVATVRDFEELAPASGTLYHLMSPWYFYVMDVLVRTDGEPMRLAGPLRARVRALDKDQACEFRTLESILAEMLGPRRFGMTLLGVYAGTALAIASAGLYGLLQYRVARQTREIGIRMALGATSGDVLGTVMKQGLALILLGVAAGLAGTLVLTRAISSLLYGIDPADPATFACISVLLTGVALIASSIPACQAARTNVMGALRHE